jgi:hypothetical protein
MKEDIEKIIQPEKTHLWSESAVWIEEEQDIEFWNGKISKDKTPANLYHLVRNIKIIGSYWSYLDISCLDLNAPKGKQRTRKLDC